jgi:hypothetical protein
VISFVLPSTPAWESTACSGTASSRLLDRTLIWNQRHLMIVLREYEDFYNTPRPCRTLSQAAPLRPLPTALQTWISSGSGGVTAQGRDS